jgi:hypothetical protein
MFLSSLIALACSSENELRPFTSDGCSLFPDTAVITADDWCSCCFVHDQAYWRGGTAEERETADIALRECVRRKTGDGTLAKMMYEGVRFGGSPYFYNWYRWGYGWKHARGYAPLTSEESAAADTLLEDYFDSTERGVCAGD